MTTKTFPLTGAINLHVRIGYGAVSVTTADDLTEATVSLTARGDSAVLDKITVGMNGPTLEVLAPRQGGLADLLGGWRHDRDAVDVDLAVPAGTAMRFSTVTAGVAVKGRTGGVDLATGSGSIALGHVDGDLRLRGGRADWHVEHVSGSVVVRSGAGTVVLGEVDGAVQAGFGSGDFEIGTVRGTLRSRTGAGNSRVDAVYGDVDLAAGAGQIGIGLPTGIAAKVDMISGSGRVMSDLPIEDANTGATKAITVRARTGSGDVRVFRAA